MSSLWGPGTIFISYRREETLGQAGRLSDHLTARFGEDRVFMDVDSIDIGTDFTEALKEAVSGCNIMLVLMGRHWAAIADSEGRRINNPEDYVRVEIETALQRGIPVVPVLVDGAALPKAKDLPPSLHPLILRQAIELRHTAFHAGVSSLIAAIEKVLGPEPGRTTEASKRPPQASVSQHGRPELEVVDDEDAASRDDVAAIGAANKVEGGLTGVGNANLYWQGWLPNGQITGVLLLCHGAGEHSGRYQNVVNTLAPDGWAVYGVDYRGHGKSSGERAHVERFSDWVDDFGLFKREVVSRHQDLPVFILGHSLGGQIALDYALDHQQAVRGLVLSAPFLATKAVSQVLRPAAKIAARLLPRARFKLVDLDKISKDPDVVWHYRNDPLVYQGNATLTFAKIVESQFEVLIKNSRYLRTPVLIQHGAEDQIADPDGSRRLYEACGSSDKTFFAYPGLWHEIYNEPERQRPLDDLREWLANHR